MNRTRRAKRENKAEGRRNGRETRERKNFHEEHRLEETALGKQPLPSL